MNGAVFGADEAVRERWERMVAARLDDGDGGRLSGALLGVSSLTLCATFGHLQVNIEYLKFEIVLIDWGALGSKNVGDEGGGRGSGASVQKKRMNASTGLCMGKVSFAVDEAALLTMLLLVEGQLLLFDAGKHMLIGTEASDIRNNTGVLEVDKCIVDDETGEVVRVEDAKVCVSSGHGSEGRFGECAGMEGFEVLNLILATGAEVVGVLTNLQVADILGHFQSLLFIGEDKGVVIATAGVILHPPFTWVVGVLILFVAVIGDGNVGRG